MKRFSVLLSLVWIVSCSAITVTPVYEEKAVDKNMKNRYFFISFVVSDDSKDLETAGKIKILLESAAVRQGYFFSDKIMELMKSKNLKVKDFFMESYLKGLRIYTETDYIVLIEIQDEEIKLNKFYQKKLNEKTVSQTALIIRFINTEKGTVEGIYSFLKQPDLYDGKFYTRSKGFDLEEIEESFEAFLEKLKEEE
ncbi:MAG TPA: hypothetical protein DHW82_03840 [Spirochaetia bacterium]|nr:MAG: hypothetical protein A2Y41_06800 [Spirochaetes bacterium GWB1_36_13]HCL56125.1 hypothetical protein [Spirochaetia bacterium]